MAKKYSDNFWFERFLFSRGITLSQGRAGMYITNLTNVIGEDYYGEDFIAHKNDDAAGTAIFPVYTSEQTAEPDPIPAIISGLMLDGINTGVKQALNLMAAGGHSANTLLGKEWDIQTVARIYAPMEDSARYDPVAYQNESAWKELGERDGHTKVSEFVNMLTAEWLVGSAADVDLESKLLRANEEPLATLAEPVTTLNGEVRYAPFMAKSAGIRKAISMDVSDESFNKALRKIQKVFGVKMVLDKALDASQTVVQTKGGLGRLADRLTDGYRRRSNKPLKSIGKVGTIRYGQNLNETDKATQLYSILKAIAARSMAPYQSEILRTLSGGEGYNLPQAGVKDDDMRYFEGATAAYISSEIVYMFVEDKKVAQQLHKEFRMEAANQLASFAEDNTWAVSLMSGVVDLVVNATAYNARFTPQNYAEAVGLPVNNYYIMDQVLFAKREYPKLTAEQIAERKDAVVQYRKAMKEREAAEIQERLKQQSEAKKAADKAASVAINKAVKASNKEVLKKALKEDVKWDEESKIRIEAEDNKAIEEYIDTHTMKFARILGRDLHEQSGKVQPVVATETTATETTGTGTTGTRATATTETTEKTHAWDEYSKNFVERVYYGEKDCVAVWKKSCGKVSQLLERENEKASDAYLRESTKLSQLEVSGTASEKSIDKQKEKLCESKRKWSMLSKIESIFKSSIKAKNIMQVFDDSEQKPEYAAARELMRVALNIAEDVVQEAGADMATYENKSPAATISKVIKNRNTAQVHKGIVEEVIKPIAKEAEEKRAKQPDPCM